MRRRLTERRFYAQPTDTTSRAAAGRALCRRIDLGLFILHDEACGGRLSHLLSLGHPLHGSRRTFGRNVGARNAAWLAAQILALNNPDLARRIDAERAAMRAQVEADAASL